MSHTQCTIITATLIHSCQAASLLQVMKWMELCAYIAAGRVGRGSHLLTGSMDSIAFAHPTRVGDSMYISAQARAFISSKLRLAQGTHLDISASNRHSGLRTFLIRNSRQRKCQVKAPLPSTTPTKSCTAAHSRFFLCTCLCLKHCPR